MDRKGGGWISDDPVFKLIADDPELYQAAQLIASDRKKPWPSLSWPENNLVVWKGRSPQSRHAIVRDHTSFSQYDQRVEGKRKGTHAQKT